MFIDRDPAQEAVVTVSVCLEFNDQTTVGASLKALGVRASIMEMEPSFQLDEIEIRPDDDRVALSLQGTLDVRVPAYWVVGDETRPSDNIRAMRSDAMAHAMERLKVLQPLECYVSAGADAVELP